MRFLAVPSSRFGSVQPAGDPVPEPTGAARVNARKVDPGPPARIPVVPVCPIPEECPGGRVARATNSGKLPERRHNGHVQSRLGNQRGQYPFQEMGLDFSEIALKVGLDLSEIALKVGLDFSEIALKVGL